MDDGTPGAGVYAQVCASVLGDTPSAKMNADSRRQLSYPKARREAGLRMSWAPGAGLEPASMTMDSRRLYQLSYPGAVPSGLRDHASRRKLSHSAMAWPVRRQGSWLRECPGMHSELTVRFKPSRALVERG